jgi:hypothetical protein
MTGIAYHDDDRPVVLPLEGPTDIQIHRLVPSDAAGE